MRTIQEYLKECDREAIANDYIYNYLFDNRLMDPKFDDVTIRDLKDRMEEKIFRLIDRLVTMEPDPGDDRGILMVIHSSGLNTWDNDDTTTILVYESEVMSDADEVRSYDYSLTRHEKMVSFFVADTYLTQHYLSELIRQFLHEALSMGPEQEHLQDFIEELQNAADESEKQEYYTFEEVMKEIDEKFGFECEVHDERQDEAELLLIQQRAEYDAVCRNIEIEKLRELIKKEKADYEQGI